MKTAFQTYASQAREKGDTALAKRIEMERRMASALVKACLERGYWVSVNDGGEWVVKHSRSYQRVMEALYSTDLDLVRISKLDDEGAIKGAGTFHLIYGNDGYDLIADHSDNEACNAIWNEVIGPLADKMQA
jgi:hypothetical protein